MQIVIPHSNYTVGIAQGQAENLTYDGHFSESWFAGFRGRFVLCLSQNANWDFAVW